MSHKAPGKQGWSILAGLLLFISSGGFVHAAPLRSPVQLAIGSPLPNSLVAGRITFSVSYSAGPARISAFTVYVDDAIQYSRNFTGMSPRGICYLELDTRTIPDGNHTIRVAAMGAGARGLLGSDSVDLTVRNGVGGGPDLVPPLVQFRGLMDGDIVSGKIPIDLLAEDNTTVDLLVSIFVNKVPRLISNRPPYFLELNTAEFLDPTTNTGKILLEAWAYDKAFNRGTAKPLTLNVVPPHGNDTPKQGDPTSPSTSRPAQPDVDPKSGLEPAKEPMGGEPALPAAPRSHAPRAKALRSASHAGPAKSGLLASSAGRERTSRVRAAAVPRGGSPLPVPSRDLPGPPLLHSRGGGSGVPAPAGPRLALPGAGYPHEARVRVIGRGSPSPVPSHNLPGPPLLQSSSPTGRGTALSGARAAPPAPGRPTAPRIAESGPLRIDAGEQKLIITLPGPAPSPDGPRASLPETPPASKAAKSRPMPVGAPELALPGTGLPDRPAAEAPRVSAPAARPTRMARARSRDPEVVDGIAGGIPAGPGRNVKERRGAVGPKEEHDTSPAAKPVPAPPPSPGASRARHRSERPARAPVAPSPQPLIAVVDPKARPDQPGKLPVKLYRPLPEGTALPRDRSYRVHRGETLAAIARKFRVTPKSLLVANGMTSARAIRAGSIVRVPGTFDIVLGDRRVAFDVTPRIENGLALAPFRQIFEHAGGVVVWYPESREVRAANDTTEVKLHVGSKEALVNKMIVVMDREAFLDSGRTMVPVSFMEKALDLKAEYDVKSGTIILSRK